MTPDANHATFSRPIRIPESWIEQRIEQTQPTLSKTALAGIRDQLAALPSDVDLSLGITLDISYFPDAIESMASKLGMDGTSLINSLTADLSNAVAFQKTNFQTRDGRNKACLVGSRWRLVVRPQRGKHSGATLLVLENVSRQEIPTRQPAFRPHRAQFVEIWDEVSCDSADIELAYDACLRASRDAEATRRALRSRLSEMHEQRSAAFKKTRWELGRGRPDDAVKQRGHLHSTARKQYSALRVMMGLLKLRSEHEQRSFDAVVAVDDTHPSSAAPEAEVDQSLRLRITGREAAQVVEEDMLVKIQPGDSARPRRARVLGVTRSGQDTVVELDDAASGYKPDETLKLTIISRFGMRAHQKAIQDFLDERVNGDWPDLATLLCCPEHLHTSPNVPSLRFFCDSNPLQPKLNDRQRAAVVGAVATPHAFCIQGPPGTGKTTVICELVQQLIAKGERILLAAPTHVAVDEVLRRIGSLEGVRALRLSWDEGRIADEVRKFTPSRIIDPFVERSQQPDSSRAGRWKTEQEAIEVAARLLEALKSRRAETATAQQALETAKRRDRDARASLETEEPSLTQRMDDLSSACSAAMDEIVRIKSAYEQAEHALNQARSAAGLGGKLLGWVWLGEIGRARRAHRAAGRSLHDAETRLGRLRFEYVLAQKQMAALRTETATAAEQLSNSTRVREKAASAETAAALECEGHDLLKGVSAAESLDQRKLGFSDRHVRLEGYQYLNRRFDELVAEVTKGGDDVEALRRDLLAVTNLFVCTTTGIAGSQELRDVLVDTFIVDEASRVTDSEFLIGAARAKRWILVGDEHQLPPYVEQDDEHFLHALSSLHQLEQNPVDLETAVDELGKLWEEDEELHKFRRESVAIIANRLRDSGDWTSMYRQEFTDGIAYLREEVDDPSRALLQSMRDNLVRSLFERIVGSCPDGLRVRLVEQRRMIRPIAEIVSEPVYGGDYCTPSDDELAVCGVTPLTTPTFPTPITFLDTSALGSHARDELLRNSFVNRTEARWVVEACKVLDQELAAAGVGAVTVSILAFYKAQARLIRDLLSDRAGGLRFTCLRFSVIDAIDRIQGQESDVVFLTFCRTALNVTPRFGQWLQDLRRLNVACTRAHRALIFVGQKDLLGKLCSNEQAKEFYRHLNELFEKRQDVMRVVRQFGGRRG